MYILIGFIALLIFITLWIYMYYCSENEIKMFADPEYDWRIRELEAKLKILEGFYDKSE